MPNHSPLLPLICPCELRVCPIERDNCQTPETLMVRHKREVGHWTSVQVGENPQFEASNSWKMTVASNRLLDAFMFHFGVEPWRSEQAIPGTGVEVLRMHLKG